MPRDKKFVILIVDDEVQLTRLLSDYFIPKDYIVLTSNGGKNAVEMIKNTPIDLVITDVRMTDGDGLLILKFIQDLKENKPQSIVMSAFTDLSEIEILDKGSIAFINKPFNIEDLEELVLRAHKKAA